MRTLARFKGKNKDTETLNMTVGDDSRGDWATMLIQSQHMPTSTYRELTYSQRHLRNNENAPPLKPSGPHKTKTCIHRTRNIGALRNFRFEADTTRVSEDLNLEDVTGHKKVKKEGLGISVVTTLNGFCYTTGLQDLRFDQENHRRVYVRRWLTERQ